MRGCPVHVWRLGHLSWPAAEHLLVAPAALEHLSSLAAGSLPSVRLQTTAKPPGRLSG